MDSLCATIHKHRSIFLSFPRLCDLCGCLIPGVGERAGLCSRPPFPNKTRVLVKQRTSLQPACQRIYQPQRTQSPQRIEVDGSANIESGDCPDPHYDICLLADPKSMLAHMPTQAWDMAPGREGSSVGDAADPRVPFRTPIAETLGSRFVAG